MHQGSPFQPGAVVDGFTLVRELGRGGMGSVWEVERGGVRYALKTATVSNDPELALRFQREAQAQARVDRHPNVVGVHTAGAWGGAPYLIMDLAPGGDLETRLEGGPLPWREAARLVADLARGLAHVHAQGVLHRDLKPANVLFDARGTPQLVDFGVAKLQDARSLTETGALMGTPAYMAPEQANGERVDARADVYGLGAILYHCLSGGPPFAGASAIAVLEKVLNSSPEPLPSSTPRELAELCLETLTKEPAQRPSLVELGARLELLLEGSSKARGAGALGLSLALALGGLLGAGGATLAVGAGSESPPLAAPPAGSSTPRPTPSPLASLSDSDWSAQGSLAELQGRADRLLETWGRDPGLVLERGAQVGALAGALRAACPKPPGPADLGRLGRLVLILRYVHPPSETPPLLAELDALTKEDPALVGDIFPLARECGAPWLDFLAAIVGPGRGRSLPTIKLAINRVDRHHVRACLEYLVLRGPSRAMAWRHVAAFHANGGPAHLPLLERSLQHFLSLNPQHSWGLVMLGSVHRARGETAQARALFEQVSRTFHLEKSLAVFWKAQLAYDEGQLETANKALLFSKSLAEENDLYPVHKTMSYWRLYYEVQIARQDGPGVALASKMLQQVTRFD